MTGIYYKSRGGIEHQRSALEVAADNPGIHAIVALNAAGGACTIRIPGSVSFLEMVGKP